MESANASSIPALTRLGGRNRPEISAANTAPGWAPSATSTSAIRANAIANAIKERAIGIAKRANEAESRGLESETPAASRDRSGLNLLPGRGHQQASRSGSR